MHDPGSRNIIPIAEKRHARLVDLPLEARLRTRLGRAITSALIKPGRSFPALRRTVNAAADALRAQGFTEEGISARLAHVVQSIALDAGLDAASVMSGKSRWEELADHVRQWVSTDAASADE